jgi:hypothetical protein
MGYLTDFLDPLAAVRPELGGQQYDFAALAQTAGHVDADGQDMFYDAMVNAETPDVAKESV